MSQTTLATIGIDLGKNTFHVVGFDTRGAIVVRHKRSRRHNDRSRANEAPGLIGNSIHPESYLTRSTTNHG